MEIIDNVNHLVGDNLKQTLTPGAKLKIAASRFSTYAFEALPKLERERGLYGSEFEIRLTKTRKVKTRNEVNLTWDEY